MWDLPGPEVKPMSLALAGALLSTGPPGKASAAGVIQSWAAQLSSARLLCHPPVTSLPGCPVSGFPPLLPD